MAEVKSEELRAIVRGASWYGRPRSVDAQRIHQLLAALDERDQLRGVVEAASDLDRFSYEGVSDKEKTAHTPDFAWIYAQDLDALLAQAALAQEGGKDG